MTNVPINDGRCLLGKITNRNAKNVWILIPRPGLLSIITMAENEGGKEMKNSGALKNGEGL